MVSARDCLFFSTSSGMSAVVNGYSCWNREGSHHLHEIDDRDEKLSLSDFHAESAVAIIEIM